MRCHGVGREPIKIEVRYAGLQSPSLEVVGRLLPLPTPLPAPLLDESLSVGLDERFCFVVIRVEEEWDSYDRKGQGSGSVGERRRQNLVDGVVEVLLPDVAVGSQRVAHHLYRDDERGRGKRGVSNADRHH